MAPSFAKAQRSAAHAPDLVGLPDPSRPTGAALFSPDPQLPRRLLPLAMSASGADWTLRIPRTIAQTGPADPHTWAGAFHEANGTWQRAHPRFRFVFWNDTLTAQNPNLQPFVAEHFAWFLPTWRKLCYKIMRLDAARYMWLHLHGGVYADLDVRATGNMTRFLRGVDVALVRDEPRDEPPLCPRVLRAERDTR